MFDSSMNIFPAIFVIKILLFVVAGWIVDFHYFYMKQKKWKDKKSIFLHWFCINPKGQMYMASKAKIHPNWDRHTANEYIYMCLCKVMQVVYQLSSFYEKMKNEQKDSMKMERVHCVLLSRVVNLQTHWKLTITHEIKCISFFNQRVNRVTYINIYFFGSE